MCYQPQRKSCIWSVMSDIQVPDGEQIKCIKIRNKTHHFEYGPNHRSFSGQARLTDHLVATFWTTAQPRRKKAPQCTLGKPVLRRTFEKKTYPKQYFYCCINVLLHNFNILYSLLYTWRNWISNEARKCTFQAIALVWTPFPSMPLYILPDLSFDLLGGMPSAVNLGIFTVAIFISSICNS